MEYVRRGEITNRFSNKLSRKSKKGMLKKLGLAYADENMNHNKQEKMMCYKCPASDLETDVSFNNKKKKKSKLPIKVTSCFQDTSSADHHASVPRKLRSAMKKRNLESIKKKNQEMDAKGIVNESISRDEKEVAETLYGLADMFTDTNSTDENTYDPLLSDGKETSKVVETGFTTKAKSLELAASDGLKQSSSVNAPISTKPTLLNLLSSTKLPHWMAQAQAVSATKNASLLSEPLRVRPRKLKRRASHIYICNLIKVLQTSTSSPVALLNLTDERSSDMSQQSRFPDLLTTISDYKTMVAPSKSYQSPKHVQENMTQLGLALYGPHTTHKQNYNFMSLSSSVAAQSHLPFPNSFPHYPISASYNTQQMQQMSPYRASRFQTAYNANQQQQQQLQKRLWVAQYRPPSSIHYSKPRPSLNLTSIQTLHVASSPRYSNNVSQQQHRFMAAAAMAGHPHHNNNHPRMVMNRQDHHFPPVYEDTRTPWQLLCNE